VAVSLAVLAGIPDSDAVCCGRSGCSVLWRAAMQDVELTASVNPKGRDIRVGRLLFTSLTSGSPRGQPRHPRGPQLESILSHH